MMTYRDLNGFIEKVNTLNSLVSSLDNVPGRRDLLASCDSHEEVISLARSWGYEIGKRWGSY